LKETVLEEPIRTEVGKDRRGKTNTEYTVKTENRSSFHADNE